LEFKPSTSKINAARNSVAQPKVNFSLQNKSVFDSILKNKKGSLSPKLPPRIISMHSQNKNKSLKTKR
jgi:hypothetical protein